jgi:hypothetical protein
MMAGSTATLAMKEPFAASTEVHGSAAAAFWPVAAVYSGRNITPEPEPPTLLG